MGNNFRAVRLVYLIVYAGIFSVFHWQSAQAAACQSVMSGDWYIASTWTNCNSSFPTTGDSAQISNGHIVTLNGDLTGYNLTSITVASDAVLQVSGVFDLNGHSLTIDGTFRINTGGFVMNGTFFYGANGTLEFSNSAGVFVLDSSHIFWPSSSSPVNIIVSGGSGGGLDLNNVARTVTGIFQTNGPVTNPDNLTIVGTLRFTDETGTFSESPFYASGSTLQYASITGGYSRGGEWGTVGDQRPFHVGVSDTTTFILWGGDSVTPREIRGNLTIDAGSTFSELNLNADFTVHGNIVVGGNLILSSGSGNLRVGGNYTIQAGGTFNNSGRWVYFQGGTNQSMAGMMTGILNRFNRILVINNSIVTFNNHLASTTGIVVEAGSTFGSNGTANFEQEDGTASGVIDCDGTCVFNNLTIREMDASGTTGTLDVNGIFTLLLPGTDFVSPPVAATFSVAKDFISNITGTGSFNANGGTITFDGGITQNLDADSSLVFANLVVSPGTILVENQAATTALSITNNGIIRKTRTIAAPGPLSFGLTDVVLNINVFTDAPVITIERHDTDHPEATSGIGSSSHKYWDITTNGLGTFDVDVILTDITMVGVGTQRTCRKDAAPVWQCEDDVDGDNSTTTRNNVTAFSAWQNCVACGPTDLTISSFSVTPLENPVDLAFLVAAVLFTGIVLIFSGLLVYRKIFSEQ